MIIDPLFRQLREIAFCTVQHRAEREEEGRDDIHYCWYTCSRERG